MPAPRLLAIQHDVRRHFGWTYEKDLESASSLREACNHHPDAERLKWTASQRAKTLKQLQEAIANAQTVVLVGAGVHAETMEREWDKNTVFIAADGAVGACLGRVDVLCVVSDLDGEPHLSQAAQHGIPLLIHAHGDNFEAWNRCLKQWASLGNVPLVLTHQSDEVYSDMHNVGGFTDGDRAACFLAWLGIKSENVRYVGFASDHVGPWSGTTDPARKLAKLAWMEQILCLLDPAWKTRRIDMK
jgi:uncharacterized Rossmann fold enzyme